MKRLLPPLCPLLAAAPAAAHVQNAQHLHPGDLAGLVVGAGLLALAGGAALLARARARRP